MRYFARFFVRKKNIETRSPSVIWANRMEWNISNLMLIFIEIFIINLIALKWIIIIANKCAAKSHFKCDISRRLKHFDLNKTMIKCITLMDSLRTAFFLHCIQLLKSERITWDFLMECIIFDVNYCVQGYKSIDCTIHHGFFSVFLFIVEWVHKTSNFLYFFPFLFVFLSCTTVLPLRSMTFLRSCFAQPVQTRFSSRFLTLTIVCCLLFARL